MSARRRVRGGVQHPAPAQRDRLRHAGRPPGGAPHADCEDAIHRGRAHRHHVLVQHHEGETPVAVARVGGREVHDGLLLPRLQPMVARKRRIFKGPLAPAAPATFPSCLPREGEDRARRRPSQAPWGGGWWWDDRPCCSEPQELARTLPPGPGNREGAEWEPRRGQTRASAPGPRGAERPSEADSVTRPAPAGSATRDWPRPGRRAPAAQAAGAASPAACARPRSAGGLHSADSAGRRTRTPAGAAPPSPAAPAAPEAVAPPATSSAPPRAHPPPQRRPRRRRPRPGAERPTTATRRARQ